MIQNMRNELKIALKNKTYQKTEQSSVDTILDR